MGKILIAENLGFVDFEHTALEGAKGDIIFVHCNPAEACLQDYTYVAVDTEKYDEWWKRKNLSEYIPRELDEILDSDFLINPYHQWQKSNDKVKCLIDVYEKNKRIELKCPIFDSHIQNFQQGRHRYWFVRNFKLPFFVVAANAQVVDNLKKQKLLFDDRSHSRYVFNTNQEIKQDLLMRES